MMNYGFLPPHKVVRALRSLLEYLVFPFHHAVFHQNLPVTYYRIDARAIRGIHQVRNEIEIRCEGGRMHIHQR